MRVGVGRLAAEATDGAAKASAVLASASASAVRTRRMTPPPGARPGAPLTLVRGGVQVCTFRIFTQCILSVTNCSLENDGPL